MSKGEVWWIVVVNLGGVTGPIKCYKKSDYEDILWDKAGDWDCDMRAGVWPLTSLNDFCSKFQTTSKQEAQIFADGARATSKLLMGILK